MAYLPPVQGASCLCRVFLPSRLGFEDEWAVPVQSGGRFQKVGATEARADSNQVFPAKISLDESRQ